jgi:O-antigen/teichoic acid export membrane protein
MCSRSHLRLSSRLSQNTLILLLNNGVSALFSFALSVLIGRVLGQDGLGIYMAALAWVYPLSLIAEFGLGTLITREFAHNPATASGLLHVSSLARLLIGGSLMVTLFVLAPVLTADPLLVRGLQISAPMIVIVPFVGTFTAVFRAHQVMWPVAWLNLGMLVAQVILTALVFLVGLSILAALAVNVLTSAGQLVAAWVLYRVRYASPALDAQLISLGVVLRQAAPFALAGVLAALQARFGVIMLEVFTHAGEVGFYAAANRFIDAARMIPNALFGALLPAISVQRERSMMRVMIGLTLYSLIIAAVMTLFAPLIINLTFGESFAPATTPLILLALSLLPSLLRSARTLYWYARGREAFTNRVMIWSVLIQVLLSLWLVPPYGASGVALTLLIAEGVAFILLMRNDPTN